MLQLPTALHKKTVHIFIRLNGLPKKHFCEHSIGLYIQYIIHTPIGSTKLFYIELVNHIWYVFLEF